MAANRLRAIPVERVWGRRDLPAGFPSARRATRRSAKSGSRRRPRPPCCVKYLFTSERLSIQVHPDDDAARARGLPRGKDEAWFVLDAEPGAVIGLGLTREVSRDALRAAALDGSIEALLDWRPVAAGDIFYSPAGTIHAIGGGIALIEVQQNLDLTYRLYDYGRPRELHLDEALAVARRGPWSPLPEAANEPGRRILAAGRAFALERWTARRRGRRRERSSCRSSSAGAIDGEALVGRRGLVGGRGRPEIAGDGVDLLVASPRLELGAQAPQLGKGALGQRRLEIGDAGACRRCRA